MKKQTKISNAVIKRLPRYRRYLNELRKKGVDKISSNEFSSLIGYTASQIRQDLNNFGGFGQQGYGYSVDKLKQEIAHILGLDRSYNVVVIGAGRIGQALMGYRSFSEEGFHLVAIFDNDEGKVGEIACGKKVQHISYLEAYLKNNTVDIAFICTPKEGAQSTADYLVSLGIRAIWNFAPVDVCVRKGVSVENVHLSDSLYVLAYMFANNTTMAD